MAVLVLLLTAFLAAAQGSDRTVVPRGNSSDSLTEALESLHSNAAVYLELGEHRIERFRLLQDLTNVSIIGLGGSSGDVVVSCAENVGLAFVNVSELTLQNLRIEGCGISQENLEQTVSRLQEIVDLFYQIPNDTYIGLFLGHCENMVVQRVTVTNTTGLGMVGINIIGNSQMNDVEFSRNIRIAQCSAPLFNQSFIRDSQQIGGGVYLLYLNYKPAFQEGFSPVTLNIQRGIFVENSDCTYEAVVIVNVDQSSTVRDGGYSIGGGGGFTVYFAQQQYSVEVNVGSSLFQNNTARYGAGVTIGLFTEVVNTRMSFNNCTVKRNGFSADNLLLKSSFTTSAAGVAIGNDLSHPASLELSSIVNHLKNVSFTFHDTFFIENGAISGGGAYVYSTFLSPVTDNSDVTYIYFNNCTFDSNVANTGSALAVLEFKLNGLFPGVQVIASDITVRGSRHISSNEFTITESSNGAAVYIGAANFTVQGESIFDSNLVTALVGSSALLGLNGNVTFIKNTGVFGGAIYISSMSHIVLSLNSSTRFIQNVGRVSGGAIYSQDSSMRSARVINRCAFFFGYSDFVFCENRCVDFNKSGIFVEFSGNEALNGSTLYGDSLENCPWAVTLRETLEPRSPSVAQMNILEILADFYPDHFKFDTRPVGVSQVQTAPEMLRISDLQDLYYAIPGQTLTLNISAYDGFRQRIVSVLSGYVVDTSFSTPGISVSATVRPGSSGFSALSNENDTPTNVTILAVENQTIFAAFYSIDNGFRTQTNIVIEVGRCPGGFKYNTATRACECMEFLKERNIECDASILALEVPRDTWVGPVSSDGELFVESCLLYCNRERKAVRILNGTAEYDSQCTSGQNRGGVGCGSCRDGYSLALGSTKCFRCSNGFVVLLLLFAMSGILLVATIAYFRITITYGFLNGMLFYSNIVSLYNPLLTPSKPYSGRLIFTSFLTLNFGIESCFHDNFTALERVGWQLIFPLYLFILMLIIAFLARFLKFKAIGGQNIIQAFSTLMLLVYVSVLQACIDLISVDTYYTQSGAPLLRWRTDPSIAYYSGVHGFLATIAILLLIFYIIPFPIILLFPSFLYRNSRLGKFKPFYDALWNPFSPSYRPWLGLRLMSRWTPFALAFFNQTPLDVFSTGILVTMQMFLLLLLKPFQSFWVNASDGLFLLNISLLFTGVLYHDAVAGAISGSEKNDLLSQATAYSTTLVMIAYIQFAAIVFYHLVIRFPWLQNQLNKLNGAVRRTRAGKKLFGKAAQPSMHADTPKIAKQDTSFLEESTLSRQFVPASVTFTELREPLLDEGVADVVSVSVQSTPSVKSDRKTH